MTLPWGVTWGRKKPGSSVNRQSWNYSSDSRLRGNWFTPAFLYCSTNFVLDWCTRPNCGGGIPCSSVKKWQQKQGRNNVINAHCFKQNKDYEKERMKTGIFEFDRVLGHYLSLGRFFPSDAGTGVSKSTSLLQALQRLNTLYFQVKSHLNKSKTEPKD